jgi:ribosomal protein S18 acetylase RimI-like enzyme
VEPEDEKVKNNPWNYVIDKGGFIYLARYKNEIIGTVSLLKWDDETFELAKIAVTQKFKGLGLGKQLLQFAIDKCLETGAQRLILYTAKKLEAAYHLYIRFGFTEVFEERHTYSGSGTKMELRLNKK